MKVKTFLCIYSCIHLGIYGYMYIHTCTYMWREEMGRRQESGGEGDGYRVEGSEVEIAEEGMVGTLACSRWFGDCLNCIL